MESFMFCISLIFGLIAFLTVFTFWQATRNVRGFATLNKMDLHLLTVIHVVRVPVEVVIYWLYLRELLPREITFAGGNLDMIAGVTAPFIYYCGIMKGKIRWQLLLVWNIAGLGLLLQLAMKIVPADLVALHFPFVLLPGAVTAVILCAHLAVIRHLIKAHWHDLKTGLAKDSGIKTLPNII